MKRRAFLAAMASAAWGAKLTGRQAGQSVSVALQSGAASGSSAGGGNPPRPSLGIDADSFTLSPHKADALDLLDYCHSLGAAGIQARIINADSGKRIQFRKHAEQLGMYYEAQVPLSDDAAVFEASLKAAQEMGARCARTVCLSGRRYENFSTLGQWNEFVTMSRARLATAIRVAERLRLPLALENHKDWTADEYVALMKEYASEWLGACLDTGNNISLLDDPIDVVQKLAPYALATHLKDMAVQETDDGFLLQEVPFGEGMLDMRRVIEIIEKARPGIRLSVEMITRNPLRIPCLTEKYWATFPDRNATYLARALMMVRQHKPAQPLRRLDGMERAALIQLEEDNVRKCLAWGADAPVRRVNLGHAGKDRRCDAGVAPANFFR